MGTTATQEALQLNLKRARAIQQATMLIHELSEAGYLAEHCRSEATYHLAELFHREDVEITTAASRRAGTINEYAGIAKLPE